MSPVIDYSKQKKRLRLLRDIFPKGMLSTTMAMALGENPQGGITSSLKDYCDKGWVTRKCPEGKTKPYTYFFGKVPKSMDLDSDSVNLMEEELEEDVSNQSWKRVPFKGDLKFRSMTKPRKSNYEKGYEGIQALWKKGVGPVTSGQLYDHVYGKKGCPNMNRSTFEDIPRTLHRHGVLDLAVFPNNKTKYYVPSVQAEVLFAKYYIDSYQTEYLSKQSESKQPVFPSNISILKKGDAKPNGLIRAMLEKMEDCTLREVRELVQKYPELRQYI